MTDSIRISTEIRIDAPCEAVWRLLTDYAGYAKWNPYLVKVEGSARAGEQIVVHSVLRPGMEPISQPVAVISAEPYIMRWEGGLPDRSRFKGDHVFELLETSAATILRHYEHFSGCEAQAIVAAHGALIEGNFMKFNQAMKAAAEA
jgi:hypothetical protein